MAYSSSRWDSTTRLATFLSLVYLAFNPSRERARSLLLERETRSSTIDFYMGGRRKQPTRPETRPPGWLLPLICYESGNLQPSATPPATRNMLDRVNPGLHSIAAPKHLLRNVLFGNVVGAKCGIELKLSEFLPEFP
jgi:hypothetical protein